MRPRPAWQCTAILRRSTSVTCAITCRQAPKLQHALLTVDCACPATTQALVVEQLSADWGVPVLCNPGLSWEEALMLQHGPTEASSLA